MYARSYVDYLAGRSAAPEVLENSFRQAAYSPIADMYSAGRILLVMYVMPPFPFIGGIAWPPHPSLGHAPSQCDTLGVELSFATRLAIFASVI
jgi:hypothetical protein